MSDTPLIFSPQHTPQGKVYIFLSFSHYDPLLQKIMKGSTVITHNYSNRLKLRQQEFSRYDNCDLSSICHRSQHDNKKRPRDDLMHHRYHVNVFPSKDSNRWIADVPDLEGSSAHGATPEEAMREVQVAIELWLESAAVHGDPIPEPRYCPAIYVVAV